MELPGFIKNSVLMKERVSPLNVKCVCAFLFFCSAIVYMNSCYNSFHLDDLGTVSGNRHLRSLENIPSFFTNPETFSDDGSAMYRPMLLVTFALNYAIGGTNVLGYHIVNIALHSFNTILLFLLLYQVILCSREENPAVPDAKRIAFYASFWIALLFGVHTINTQAVNYISSRSVLLVTFFYLSAFNLYIRSSGRPALYSLSFLFYFSAFLSKEIGVTFPVAIFAYSLLFEVPKKRSAILRVIPFILLNLIGLMFMSGVYGLGGVELSTANIVEGRGMPRGIWSNLLTQAAVLTHYLRLFIFPSGLAIMHDFPVHSSVKEPEVIFSLVVFLTLLVTGFALMKNHRAVIFGILWFFIVLIPETIIPLNLVVNEHRTYLPFAGFLLVPASAIASIAAVRPGRVLLVSIAMTVIVAVLGVSTVLRNQIWKNEITMLEDNVLKSPENFLVSDALTDVYIGAGQTEKAMLNVERSLNLNPARSAPYFDLGIIYLKAGDYSESIKNLRLALRFDPESPRRLNMLGVALLESGQAREALELFVEAEKSAPVWDQIPYNMGRAYFELQAFDEAVRSFEKSIELNPEYFDAYNNLGLAHMSRGNYRMALKVFGKALELQSGSLVVLNNIAIIHLETGDLKNALSVLEKISGLDPLFPDGLNTFGEYYLKTGEYERALGFFEKTLSLKATASGHWNAAVTAEKKGDIQTALEHWNRFLKISPDSPENAEIEARINELEKEVR